MKRAEGFTLIEMMVVVALVAILGMVAVPGFRDLLMKQRLASNTSDFVAALSLARTESMKRSQSVTLTPVSQDWSNGWEVSTTVDWPSGGLAHLRCTSSGSVGGFRPRQRIQQIGQLQRQRLWEMLGVPDVQDGNGAAEFHRSLAMGAVQGLRP